MKKNAIGIEDAVLLDNKLWFILSDYKSLVSMDIETKETKSYTIPTEEAYVQKRAFGSMALVGRKIYLIPFYERVIMQFDADSEEFKEVEIDSRIIENKNALFLGIGMYQNYLFIMGVDVPAVLRVNTINNHIDYITNWQQEVENLIFDFNDAYFRKQSAVLNNKLFAPFCNANAVLEIDCISMKTVIHSLGEEKKGYSGICFEGSSFWLSPRKNGSMVKWDLDTKRIENIEIPEAKGMGNILTYTGIVSSNGQKLLLPITKKQTTCIEGVNVTELSGVYSFVQDDEIRIIFADKNSGILTVIERESNTQSEIEIGKVKVDIEKILYESGNTVVENEVTDVRNFIEFVQTNI